LVPNSSRLLETVKGLLEFEGLSDVLREMVESFRRANEDDFIVREIGLDVGRVDIGLVDEIPMLRSKSEKETNGVESGDGGKGVFEVDTLSLRESLSHQSSLVNRNLSEFVPLGTIDELRPNSTITSRDLVIVDDLPNSQLVERRNLLVHRYLPLQRFSRLHSLSVRERIGGGEDKYTISFFDDGSECTEGLIYGRKDVERIGGTFTFEFGDRIFE
jgi:hypothetical protein